MITHVLVRMWRFDRPIGRAVLAETLRPRASTAELLLWGPDFDFTGELEPPSAATWGSIEGFTSRRRALGAIQQSDGPSRHVVETWRAVGAVTSHRGDVNWNTLVAEPPALRSVEAEVEGPLAIVTTAGFDLGETFDLDRVVDWFTEFQAVRDTMAETPGLLLQQYFQPELPWDPLTFTLWRDEASMYDFAYRPGPHRQRIDWYRNDPTDKADRTSFTRLRIIAARGTWGGITPLETAEGEGTRPPLDDGRR